MLENDAEFQRWHIERRNALRLARDRGAQAKLASDLEAMRGKAADDLGPAAADQPAAAPAAVTPQAQAPQRQPAPRFSNSGNSRDFGIHIGGALDPIAAGMVAVLVASAWYTRRRAARTR